MSAPFGHGLSLEGVRIKQVEPGTVINGGHVVTDDQGVMDERENCVYVTERNYEAIRASAREMGQVTYSRR